MHTGKLFSEINSWKEVLKFLMKRFLKPQSIPACIRTSFILIMILKFKNITRNILMKTYTGSKIFLSFIMMLKSFSQLVTSTKSRRQLIFYPYLNSIFKLWQTFRNFCSISSETKGNMFFCRFWLRKSVPFSGHFLLLEFYRKVNSAP